jgi:3-hydroxyacyl-CoA dehydrogenase
MKAEGLEPAAWVSEMIARFYTIKEGATYFYNIPTKSQTKVPGQDAFYHPEQQRNQKSLGNSGAIIQDLGDGILNLEFQSKMNTIGGDVLVAINKAIDLSEK